MVSITLTIEDTKFQKFKKAFIEATPVPINPDDESPLYTDNEWIKEWIKRMLQKRYRQGVEELARQTASVDDNIVS